MAIENGEAMIGTHMPITPIAVRKDVRDGVACAGYRVVEHVHVVEANIRYGRNRYTKWLFCSASVKWR